MDRPLRLGTRGSPLALAQAQLVASALRMAHGWDEEAIEIVPITTTGDRVQDRALAEVGGKALWTKELDRCLVDGRTDMSVHSMKDVETIRPDELVVAAMLPRADARDRLIGAESLAALPKDAKVGTSSPRRAAQVKARRPDLETVVLRGNVQTRLAKVERGEVDATLLAAAGLDRLGLGNVGSPADELLPAASQGAVGVETLKSNGEVRALL
ncbi:MAG TPA: hydroxymethylbilane synthase, partial [Allosphingosinicella sp.]